MTYEELNARANRWRTCYARAASGPERVVGVCLSRSAELVIALLGIVKAGGAYVPLEPTDPPARLAALVADVGAALVVTDTAGRGRLPAVPLLTLDDDAAIVAAAPTTDPEVAVGPEHLAYVIYTSGSTGTPKGAMNTHAGIVNRLQWMQEAYGLQAGSRVVQKTPHTFDVSVWEFFWPLMTGATLVMARPEGHRDAEYLCELIATQRVTTVHFVPSMLPAFLAQPGLAACTSLTQIFCSGEALPADAPARVMARLPGVALHNLYGPTEAAVDVSFWACTDQRRQRAVSPIGRPIANTRLYVLIGGASRLAWAGPANCISAGSRWAAAMCGSRR